MHNSQRFHLHHVGHAVPEIGPAAETYAKRFGYAIASPVIHDPAQTAYVQFLQLPGTQPYLELVAPDGPASKLVTAVKKRGGLNHFCYTASKLEPAIEQLEAQGMRLVSTLEPAVAFAGRRICWLLGDDNVPVELVERTADDDLCTPGTT